MSIYSQHMEAHLAPCDVLLSSWWRRNQNSRTVTYQTPQTSLEEIVRGLGGLEGRVILWSETKVGLQTTNGWFKHANIHACSSPQISTQTSGETTTRTLQSCSHQIWNQNTNSPWGQHPAPFTRTNQVCATSGGGSVVLQSSWPHNSCSPQFHLIKTIKRHESGHGSMQSTPWLLCNPSKPIHLLSCKWHDTRPWHRQIISLRTQR